MSTPALDPRFTFDTFVVGTANRLASAAARRVAESPGTSYNPLFIYSASGLGKTHLVMALGQHASKLHADLRIEYSTLEGFMDEVTAAIEAGERDAFRSRISGAGLLILDDVQFLAGRLRTQEELLHAWDALSARGGQVVLASDRPPQEIDSLDERLLSRFSGGLIVDIGVPDYETRVAIIRQKAAEAEQELTPGVAEALARISFTNVRELRGALNRLLALQDLEGRIVDPTEVPLLIGIDAPPPEGAEGEEFGEFLAEIAETVERLVAPSPGERQLARAVLRWEGEGYQTRRLEQALGDPLELAETEALIRGFETEVERLREVANEISSLEPDASELGRQDVLRDPDRLSEALELLEQVRERTLPVPAPPEGPDIEALPLPLESFARRAATAVAERPGGPYNPLFLHDAEGARSSELLHALGRRLARNLPESQVALLDAPRFAAELIRALERRRVDGWRERYRRVGALLIDRVDGLAETERAQEELFHLFDALHRAGVQLAFAASRPPAELEGIEERLRTRLGSGLVVEVEPEASDGSAGIDEFFCSREKIVLDWPYLAELLDEEQG